MNRVGFTLIEALIAIALVAVALPVAIAGISAATRAASDVRSHAIARRLADGLLAKLVANGGWQTSAQSGAFTAADDGDEAARFTWQLATETWRDPTIRTIAVTVAWEPASDAHQVIVTTLAAPPASSTGTSTTGTAAATP